MSKFNKPSILIVEDEPLIADDIAMILERNGYTISEILDNAEDALNHLSNNNVDLILCDVNIEGDADGIQLAHQINSKFQIPIIFLTSYYDNNTLKRAKAAKPAAYIVKPFDEGDLVANIELVSLKSGSRSQSPIIEKFFVRDKSELKAIEIHDIVYVESDDNYANIYTGNNKYVVSHTLKSVQERLPESIFIRIHKSYLINFNKITSIYEGIVYLDEVKLNIGRAYKEELLKKLAIL